MPISLLLVAYLAVVGLIVGSYLNVVIHRLPRGLSTVLPRSCCPACQAKIHPLDNLPVLSFVLLRGRCRRCRAPISWRYPVVETTSAVLFVLCYLRFGLRWESLVAVFFCCLMILLAVIDLEHFILPDRLTLPGVVLGIAAAHWVSWTTLLSALLGALLGAAVLLAMAGAWYLIRREAGMGMGDVKMLATIGAFLGLPGMVVSLFIAALSGAAVGLSLIAFGRLDMKSKLPFGFFLALGAVVSLLAGRDLAAAYARLL